MNIAKSLKEIIQQTIHKTGPLTVAEYMNICLNHDQYGYYKSQKIFGREGDFITAPEISQIFGELLAIWLLTAWQQQNSPEKFILCEAGPGRGTLMYDVLRTITKLNQQMLTCATIILVENSPKLIQEQKAKLFEFLNMGINIKWQADITSLKPEPLFFIANEFLDALPIQQYTYSSAKFYERKITLNNHNEFIFISDKSPTPLSHNIYNYNLPNNSIIEISDLREEFIKTIAQHIAAHSGVALLIDYGEITPAHGDTLQAVQKHQYVGLFQAPGKADLTSQVDFYSLAKIADLQGCDSYGTSQGELLNALGAKERAFKLLKQQSATKILEITNAIDRLINPKHMGTLFKALALAPQFHLPPVFTPEKKL